MNTVAGTPQFVRGSGCQARSDRRWRKTAAEEPDGRETPWRAATPRSTRAGSATPKAFWREAARAIDWIEPPREIFDANAGIYGRWFPDATLNACFNCLDRHIRDGRGAQAAVIYDAPVIPFKKAISYDELLDEVQAMAAVLQDFGVGKGDRVIVYLPMLPRAHVAMLACARIGAIHSVVFGGFSATELAVRIDDARPKLILTASCGIEGDRTVPYKPLVDAAIDKATAKPDAVLVWQRPRLQAEMIAGRDHDWEELVEAADGRTVACEPMAATDPLYILYTSGTTGVPKGVVRDTGGYSRRAGLVDGRALRHRARRGVLVRLRRRLGRRTQLQRLRAAADRRDNHLLRGQAGRHARRRRLLARLRRMGRGLALHRAHRIARDQEGGSARARSPTDHDLSRMRALFLAGERADAPTVEWAMESFGLPVIDHWWQTETGWCIAGNPKGLGLLPIKPGSATVPMPGYALEVVDEAGLAVPADTMGNLLIKLPLPPGSLPTLWRNDGRMRDSYLVDHPGAYKTSDAGFIDADGHVFLLGRTDDIINCAGHRLSTGGIEEVLARHPDVAECAVIGMADPVKGEVPCGFLVLKSGVDREAGAIAGEAVSLVRDAIGPVASFRTALVVDRLPKTRSGKILRGTMKKIADGDSYTMPATIEDPATLDTIAVALAQKV